MLTPSKGHRLVEDDEEEGNHNSKCECRLIELSPNLLEMLVLVVGEFVHQVNHVDNVFIISFISIEASELLHVFFESSNLIITPLLVGLRAVADQIVFDLFEVLHASSIDRLQVSSLGEQWMEDAQVREGERNIKKHCKNGGQVDLLDSLVHVLE